MLSRFDEVWDTLGMIISALPGDMVTVACTVFVFIGIVGVLRSI